MDKDSYGQWALGNERTVSESGVQRPVTRLKTDCSSKRTMVHKSSTSIYRTRNPRHFWLKAQSSQLKASHKAQVATEFMLYVSAFMFIVIAAFISISYIQAAEIPARESALVKEVGEGFSNAVTLAATSGRGFSYNYTFPRTVLNKEYKIIFDKDNARLLIEWQGTYNEFTYVYPVVAADYDFEGGCIDERRKELLSTKCANKIDIYNNGEKLIIYHRE